MPNKPKTKKREWFLTQPQNYRDMHKKGFVEAICPHGVGHHKGIHGCDLVNGHGCCYDCPKELWEKVTKD